MAEKLTPQEPVEQEAIDLPKESLIQQLSRGGDAPTTSSFGDRMANLALGLVPVAGPILQQRHNEKLQRENLIGTLSNMAPEISQWPQEQQQHIISLVQAGQPHAALKQTQQFAEDNIKAIQKTRDNARQLSALNTLIPEIAPGQEKAFQEIARTAGTDKAIEMFGKIESGKNRRKQFEMAEAAARLAEKSFNLRNLEATNRIADATERKSVLADALTVVSQGRDTIKDPITRQRFDTFIKLKQPSQAAALLVPPKPAPDSPQALFKAISDGQPIDITDTAQVEAFYGAKLTPVKAKAASEQFLKLYTEKKPFFDWVVSSLYREPNRQVSPAGEAALGGQQAPAPQTPPPPSTRPRAADSKGNVVEFDGKSWVPVPKGQ